MCRTGGLEGVDVENRAAADADTWLLASIFFGVEWLSKGLESALGRAR
jgi:hypothetical protein